MRQLEPIKFSILAIFTVQYIQYINIHVELYPGGEPEGGVDERQLPRDAGQPQPHPPTL